VVVGGWGGGEVDSLGAVVVDRVGGEAVAGAVVHLDAEIAAVRDNVVRADLVVVVRSVDDAHAGRVAEVQRVGPVGADVVPGDPGRAAGAEDDDSGVEVAADHVSGAG